MLLHFEHAAWRDAHRGAQDLLHSDRRGRVACTWRRNPPQRTQLRAGIAPTYARRAVQPLWEANPRSKTGMVGTFDTAAPLFWPTAVVLLARAERLKTAAFAQPLALGHGPRIGECRRRLRRFPRQHGSSVGAAGEAYSPVIYIYVYSPPLECIFGISQFRYGGIQWDMVGYMRYSRI